MSPLQMSTLGSILPSFSLPCQCLELPIFPWRTTVHGWPTVQCYHIIPALNTVDNSDPNTALGYYLIGQRKALKVGKKKTSINENMLGKKNTTDFVI